MVHISQMGIYADMYEFPNVAGEMPLTCVTWPMAKRLAAWQGKRLPSLPEYDVYANWSAWDAYGAADSRAFKPSGGPPSITNGFGMYDVMGNVMEWTDQLSPLGDRQTYGLAMGGTWPQVQFPDNAAGPCAEYPAGSWARDINLYNHSEIGFRCVIDADEALRILNGGATEARRAAINASAKAVPSVYLVKRVDLQGRIISTQLTSSTRKIGNPRAGVYFLEITDLKHGVVVKRRCSVR